MTTSNFSWWAESLVQILDMNIAITGSNTNNAMRIISTRRSLRKTEIGRQVIKDEGHVEFYPLGSSTNGMDRLLP